LEINLNDKRSGNKHYWSLVMKSLKHLLGLQISFFFVAKSQSLCYVPNHVLSNQRQTIWSSRQMLSHVKQAPLFIQIEVWTPLINKTSLHSFTKTTKQRFSNMLIGITWISSEQVCFKLISKWFLCLEYLFSYSLIPIENLN
jgi:hypothetical protein